MTELDNETDAIKKGLYDNYVSHHTSPRKGKVTNEVLNNKAASWDKSFAKYMPTSTEARIADLGCGDGALLWWLQSRGYKSSYGVDISEEQISLSRKAGVFNTEQKDVFQFLRENECQFDVIIMRDLLEHLTKSQIFSIITLITKSLKPGGRLIVQVPNGASPFFGATLYGDLTHETAFTSTSLSQLFANFPFENIDFDSCPPSGITLKSKIRICLWYVLHSFIHLYLTLESGRRKRILTQNIIAIAKLK